MLLGNVPSNEPATEIAPGASKLMIWGLAGGPHVPGGLGLPGGIRDLVGERVGGDRHLRYSHEVGHRRRDVRREVGREMRLVYPPVAIAVWLECLWRLREG